MPRPKEPARLDFDEERGVWIIRDFIDGKRYKRRTRHGREARREAEKELALHVAEQARLEEERRLAAPDPDDPANKDPRLISIAACLAYYGRQKEDTKNAALTGQHIVHLLRHWKGKTLAQITGSTCRAYVAARTRETYSAPGSSTVKFVQVPTARRELQTLSAAVGEWHREHTLTARPLVTLPETGEAHPDWLTEVEYERLLVAAAGYRWVATDLATREPIWERVSGLRTKPSDHLVRFVHMGFFTGSRSAAMLNARWKRHRTAGFVDFASMTFFREGPEAEASRKRNTPCRIHDRLLPLLRGWQAADAAVGITRVIHNNGKAIKRVSKGFRLAVMRACLDRRDVDGTYRIGGEELAFHDDEAEDRVAVAEKDDDDDGDVSMGWPTPHILRHTRATLALARGVPVQEVAEYLGLTPGVVLDTYGHTASEYQERMASA